MPDLPDAAQALLDAPGHRIILAGLLDGADHAKCESCRDVMRQAHAFIVALRAALAAARPEDVNLTAGQIPKAAHVAAARPETDYDEQDVKVTYLTPGDIATARQATEIQAAARPPAPADDDRYQVALAVIRKLYPQALTWPLRPEARAEMWEQFVTADRWTDAERVVLGHADRPAPSGLCPVCGQWPHNCDPQVDHTGGGDDE